MTTPPQRPGDDPGWRGRVDPPDPATRRLPSQGRPPGPPQRGPVGPGDQNAAQPTQRIPRRPDGDVPTQKIRQQPPAGYPSPQGAPPPQGGPTPPRAGGPPPPPGAFGGAPPSPPAEDKPRRSGLRSPKSIILIVVIIVAVIFGGVAGAEVIARKIAADKLDTVIKCITQDDASTVSFSTTPPFLWQYLTSEFADISVSTGGTRIREATGMKADITLTDIKLEDTADSAGTIGSLAATIAWTSDGIKQTVAENVPMIGDQITAVTTDASAGTMTIETKDFSVSAKPTVNDGALGLEVVELQGGLLQSIAQTALNSLTDKLKDNYPLGIKADSVEVTDTGVVGKFSSQNASIPQGEGGSELDQCFQDL